MVRAKICGITNLKDALVSVQAGCDALGFNFYKKSPRYIAPLDAKEIIKLLPKRIIKIGVFVNAKEKSIRHIARACHLDMLQFHGNETPQFCARFKNLKIIKAFRIKNSLDLENVAKYKPFAYLFDTRDKLAFGGTGKSFDWKLIRHIGCLKQPIFLSGGLTEKNVKIAIKTVNPAWVDVCSSVESAPGKKDPQKVKNFIKAVKSL